MSLFKKFQTVLKANVNSLLDKLEDPEKLSEQAVLDLRESLHKAKEQKIALMALNNLLKSKATLENQEAVDYQVQKNQQAIKEIDDFIAQLEEKIADTNQRIIDIKATKLRQKTSTTDTDKKDYFQEDAPFKGFEAMEEKIEEQEFLLKAAQELLQETDIDKKTIGTLTPEELALELEKLRKSLTD